MLALNESLFFNKIRAVRTRGRLLLVKSWCSGNIGACGQLDK